MENNFNFDKENLKSETSSTINEAKETIKNINFRNDTTETKGVLIELFKNPINKIKDIVNNQSFLKTAMILIIVWTLAVFIKSIFVWGNFGYFFKYNVFKNVLSILKTALAPALGIVVMSIIVLIMNKSSKKSLTTIITTVTIAKVPTILASVAGLLTIISSEISKITSPFSSFCAVISTILLYFGVKELYDNDDDNSFIRTIIIIEGVYSVAKFAISFLGIYL